MMEIHFFNGLLRVKKITVGLNLIRVSMLLIILSDYSVVS